MIVIVRSFRKWCGWLKWWATGLSNLRSLIWDQCCVRRTRCALFISLPYWVEHLAHSIKYTAFLVLQSAVVFTQNSCLEVKLSKVMHVLICAHALHRGWWHHPFPLYFSHACFKAALTRRDLRLAGHRQTTRGDCGRAPFNCGVC